jgi:MoaA/NifB/PqqE/SkfB family radical SAM enzyme
VVEVIMMDRVERKVCWRILRRCNLSCSHCLAGNLNLFKDELDTEACLSIVERFAECELDRVVITGGEPLLRKDLEAVLFSLSTKVGSIHLTTNGLGLSSRRITSLGRYVDAFRVSVDGLKETHDGIRRNGSFHSTVLGINRALAQGCKVIVNTVLCGKNIHEIPLLIETLAAAGVRKFVLLELMLRERGVSFAGYTVSSSALYELRERISPILSSMPDLNIQLRSYSQPDHVQVVVESDGSVMLCREAGKDLCFGNLCESALPLREALSRQRIPSAQEIAMPKLVAQARMAP